ncbi:MAG: nitroreductase [Paracoccus sp. (in: a-proteobacteria)]
MTNAGRQAGDVATLKRLMQDRFTCRAFQPDPVPADTIRDIVEMAGCSASWCNIQPWGVIVTSGAETDAFRATLMRAAADDSAIAPEIAFPERYEGVFQQRRRETGYALYASLGIERQDYPRRRAQAHENFRLFGAPHVAIITGEAAIGPYGLVDCGGFVASFLLAARAHGVDTAPQASLAEYSGLIRTHFDIDPARQIICGISFGYADPDHAANGFRTSRAEVDEIAQFR